MVLNGSPRNLDEFSGNQTGYSKKSIWEIEKQYELDDDLISSVFVKTATVQTQKNNSNSKAKLRDN